MIREVEVSVYKDPMTHLYNRRYGMEAITRLVDSSKQLEIAFVDMDSLKYINDTFGHEDGNLYIQETAAVLSRLREPKLICRIGGDEFLVVSEGTKDLEVQLEEAAQPLLNATSTATTGLSASGVVNSANYTGDISDMIRDADIRMYQYKIKHKKTEGIKLPQKTTDKAKLNIRAGLTFTYHVSIIININFREWRNRT